MSQGGPNNTPLPLMTKDFFNIFDRFVKEQRHAAGELIFEEGSSADRFFIIKEGEIEIRKVIDRQEGRYKPVSVLTVGEFFGEMAVFLGQPRSADAVAKTDVTLLPVSADDFSALFSSSPDTAFRAMRFFTLALMDRLRNTTEELATVYETGRLVAASRSVAELSDQVLEGVLRAVDSAEAGLFVIWNEFNSEFEIFRQKGFDLEAGTALHPDDPLIRWLTENRETFLSFDLLNDKRLTVPADGVYLGCSIVASPFSTHGRLIGFLLILNRSAKNAFSYNQMILVSAISGYVSVTLDNLNRVQEEIDRSRLNQVKATIPF